MECQQSLESDHHFHFARRIRPRKPASPRTMKNCSKKSNMFIGSYPTSHSPSRKQRPHKTNAWRDFFRLRINMCRSVFCLWNDLWSLKVVQLKDPELFFFLWMRWADHGTSPHIYTPSSPFHVTWNILVQFHHVLILIRLTFVFRCVYHMLSQCLFDVMLPVHILYVIYL